MQKLTEAKKFLMENGAFTHIGKLGPYESENIVDDLYDSGASKVYVSGVIRDYASTLHIEAAPFASKNILHCICKYMGFDRLSINNNIFEVNWKLL